MSRRSLVSTLLHVLLSLSTILANDSFTSAFHRSTAFSIFSFDALFSTYGLSIMPYFLMSSSDSSSMPNDFSLSAMSSCSCLRAYASSSMVFIISFNVLATSYSDFFEHHAIYVLYLIRSTSLPEYFDISSLRERNSCFFIPSSN